MMQLSVPFEIKSISGRKIVGHGSVFGNVDHGGDVVVKGAFKRSLAEHRKQGTAPLMFWMHQPDLVPGVWHDVDEDDKGLLVEGEVVDTSLGKDVQILLEKKAVRGLSIGYRPVDVDWREDGARLLKQVDLFEVSIVSLAMNPLARITSKMARLSADGEYVPTEREFEQMLRNVGCSQRVSRTLIAKMFDGEGGADGAFASSHWDGGKAEDDEGRQMVDTLLRLTDKVYASALRRP